MHGTPAPRPDRPTVDPEATTEEPDINDGLSLVSYVAEDGVCRPHQGYGWQPVNEVNRQAWQEIESAIARSREMVDAGMVSCLHYYMTANQMTPSLLARYANLPGWLIRLHLRPFFFRRISRASLARYAELFGISAEDLAAGRLRPPVYQRERHG